ncbi:carbohydrate ABC transporter permease [Paenibacillus sp. KN14-4R]|uniref:carbohydrate ABC transporter permease n=1 Tax=Paenibacillus sp. KN14-4R TaxID=3445773 RepID=UPI003F9F5AC3
MNTPIIETKTTPTKPKRALFHYRRKESFKDFLLALPALLLLGIFTYYPLANSVYLSFTDWNMLKPIKKFIGFSNYEKLLVDPELYHTLKVTFLYTIIEVSLELLIGLALAVLFNVMSRAFSAMRLIIFMPHYISMVVASMVFIWIYNPDYGILNSMLKLFGISPVNWLTNPSTALWAVIIVAIWKGVGFTMIIFISGLRGIPLDYYEAASIDGANKWHQLRYITIPLLSPTTLFLVITSFISSMQVFQSVDVMTNGGPLKSTHVMVYWIYEMSFGQFKVGKASALIIMFFILIIALTAIQLFISKKKVHYEG